MPTTSLPPIKKLILASLILPLCLGLTACKDDNNSSSNSNSGNNNSTGKTPAMDCAPTK